MTNREMTNKDNIAMRPPENGFRALVTGGGGFLGSAIVERLVKRGDKVISFSRKSHPKLDRFKVEQIQGDIADAQAVKSAVEGVDVVFNVAGKPGVGGKYEAYHKTNVVGTRNVIEACLAANVPYLIHTSSPSAVFNGGDMEGVDESVPYPDKFKAHYPKTKALAEQEVRAVSDRLNTICLRPHLIWGPGDNHLVPRILARSKRLRRMGEEDKLVDTVYIDNAADAHILAADRLRENPGLSGKVYFITQGEPIPLWDMVDAILEAGGKPRVKKKISAKTAKMLGSFFDALYRIFRIEKEPPMTRFVAEELSTAHWFDIGAAKRDLGYAPAVSTQEGLCRLRSWLREETTYR